MTTGISLESNFLYELQIFKFSKKLTQLIKEHLKSLNVNFHWIWKFASNETFVNLLHLTNKTFYNLSLLHSPQHSTKMTFWIKISP